MDVHRDMKHPTTERVHPCKGARLLTCSTCLRESIRESISRARQQAREWQDTLRDKTHPTERVHPCGRIHLILTCPACLRESIRRQARQWQDTLRDVKHPTERVHPCKGARLLTCPTCLRESINRASHQARQWNDTLRCSEFSDLELLFKNAQHLDAYCTLYSLTRKLNDRKTLQDIYIKDKVFYKVTLKERLRAARETATCHNRTERGGRSWLHVAGATGEERERVTQLLALRMEHTLQGNRLRDTLRQDKRWLSRLQPALQAENGPQAASLISKWSRTLDTDLRRLAKKYRVLHTKIRRRKSTILTVEPVLCEAPREEEGLLLEFDPLANTTKFECKWFKRVEGGLSMDVVTPDKC